MGLHRDGPRGRSPYFVCHPARGWYLNPGGAQGWLGYPMHFPRNADRRCLRRQLLPNCRQRHRSSARQLRRRAPRQSGACNVHLRAHAFTDAGVIVDNGAIDLVLPLDDLTKMVETSGSGETRCDHQALRHASAGQLAQGTLEHCGAGALRQVRAAWTSWTKRMRLSDTRIPSVRYRGACRVICA